MRSQPGAVARGIGRSQNQGDVASVARRQGIALELRGPKLGLEVHEDPLDLDVNPRFGPAKHHVRGATIVRSHGNLELNLPPGMRRVADGLGQVQLTGIAQRHGRDRIEAPAELVATGCGHLA